MSGLFEKGLLVGLGLVDLSQEKLEEVVNDLAKRGEVARKDSRRIVQRVLKRGLKERRELEKRIHDTVRRAMERMDLATARELGRLEKRVADLEEKLAAARRGAGKQEQ